MKTEAEAKAARWLAHRFEAAKRLLSGTIVAAWNGRLAVLGVGGAICALGLAAAVAAPPTYTARLELAALTLLAAGGLGLAAGISRGMSRPGLSQSVRVLEPGARPPLRLVHGRRVSALN